MDVVEQEVERKCGKVRGDRTQSSARYQLRALDGWSMNSLSVKLVK